MLQKVAMPRIEPLTENIYLSTDSRAYQLSQLIHHASADIFKNISTVPLTSSSSFVIFLYLFFFTCSLRNHIYDPPTRV